MSAVAAPPTDPSSRRRWLRWLGHTISTLGLIAVFVIAGLMVLPRLLGYDRFAIISGSMEPALGVGSVVYDKPVPVASLVEGDVVTFVPPPEYHLTLPVTHRIIEITEARNGTSGTRERVFRTKGDANEHADPWRMRFDEPEQPLVMHHIEKLGYIYVFLNRRWAQLLFIGLPALIITIAVLRALWIEAGAGVADERRRKQMVQGG